MDGATERRKRTKPHVGMHGILQGGTLDAVVNNRPGKFSGHNDTSNVQLSAACDVLSNVDDFREQLWIRDY